MTQQQKVEWINDYNLGMEKCHAEKKPMLLDFFRDG